MGELGLDDNLKQMAMALAAAMEARDSYVRGHSENVAQLARDMGKEIGLSAIEIGNLWLAGIVHDIGKVGISGEILNKPGPLNEYERQLVETHVEISLRIVEQSSFPSEIALLVAQHHERLDGSGYPRQLNGNQIVFGARILAVADVFDAATSLRPYRSALTIETALNHLTQQAGILYDRAAVDALLKVRKGKKDG